MRCNFYPTLDATLKIVSSATMGLTIQLCADATVTSSSPIPQTDYYRLQAIFMAAYRPRQWIPQMERRRWTLSESQKKQADKRNAEVDANVKKLTQEIATDKKTFATKLFEKRLAELPVDQQALVKEAVQHSPRASVPTSKRN